MTPDATAKLQQRLAVTAQSLYLANLMIAPVFAFIGLLYLYLANRNKAEDLVLSHMRQAINAAVIGGSFLFVFVLCFLLLGGLQSVYGWMALLLYFTCIHAAMILFGVIALVKAMAGQPYTYPLIGSLAHRWLH